MTEAIRAASDAAYPAAVIPTMYFIGVTTGSSSIMKVFPRWAQHLGIGAPQDVTLKGIDCKQHDDPEVYRRIVLHIKKDELSKGALVTTHKIDLLKACREMFDELYPYAELMGEVSSISKRNGRLIGHAKDPITSGLALGAFLPKDHWRNTGGEALVLGAGGSSIALTSYMMQEEFGSDRPARIVVTNRSTGRLDEIRGIHEKLHAGIAVEYHHTPNAENNDAVINGLAPHSLVVNATGLGKDAPGSPLTDAARFPEHGLAWDFNYRGDLVFLEQARRQQAERKLAIEDGWGYFVHGWTRVIAEVFDLDIPTGGPEFDELSAIAAAARE
ncbi:MAG: shikimate dehydrogenase [Planctomycetes bacterium]|nr:shikimate dehydrogenase [Planctomycetota bacterium]